MCKQNTHIHKVFCFLTIKKISKKPKEKQGESEQLTTPGHTLADAAWEEMGHRLSGQWDPTGEEQAWPTHYLGPGRSLTSVPRFSYF